MIAPLILAAALSCWSPRPIDGDTLVCAGQRVRLYGINSPELHSPGGPEAKARLAEMIRGQTVVCVPFGNKIDRYGRTVARCAAGSIPDIGVQMLRENKACRWKRWERAGVYASIGRDCEGHVVQEVER